MGSAENLVYLISLEIRCLLLIMALLAFWHNGDIVPKVPPGF